jgi:hypothetical protein
MMTRSPMPHDSIESSCTHCATEIPRQETFFTRLNAHLRKLGTLREHQILYYSISKIQKESLTISEILYMSL